MQQKTVPECFDPQFLSQQICFDDTNLLEMIQDPTQALQQMVRLRTEVISNICCAFYHLIPGFWSNGDYLRREEGLAFIDNLQWFLGSSLSDLQAAGEAPANEAPAQVQMHGSHLRVVHMTVACIKRIIDCTGNSMPIPLHMLPACLKTMLELNNYVYQSWYIWLLHYHYHYHHEI